jgi:flagellar hook-basal body complex protein FliE
MIDKISGNNLLINESLSKKNTGKVSSFADTLKDYIKSVNDDQIAAKESVTKYLRGETKDIHSTVISIEKADISLQLMLQLRNKVIQSFQEIMRIQI